MSEELWEIGTPLQTPPSFFKLAYFHKVMGQEGAVVYPHFADGEKEAKSCA